MEVELLVEGYTDEVFMRHCLAALGLRVGVVYGKRGIAYVRERAQAFCARGHYTPILVLADLVDMHAPCPAVARSLLASSIPHLAMIRFAVPEVESWLLASRSELAAYLRVPISRVPTAPDELQDAKQVLVNLARGSTSGRIRDMFVPRPNSSASRGSGYVEGFCEFMAHHWRLSSALATSPSLARLVERVRERFGSSPVH